MGEKKEKQNKLEYWDTTAHYSKYLPTYEMNGTPRLSERVLLFAQMRGVLLHMSMFQKEREASYVPWDYKTWHGSDALETFYGYAHECGYVPLKDAFEALGDEGNDQFIQYWHDCRMQEIGWGTL